MDLFGAAQRSWNSAARALVRPFDLGAWLAFGFVSFLASLVDPGLGFSGRGPNLPGTSPPGGRPSAPLPDLDEPLRALSEHSDTILVAGALVLVATLAAGALAAWIGCRGLMIAYRSAHQGRVAIGEGWRETRAPANALFRLHLALSLVGLLVMLPVLGLAAARLWGEWEAGERDAAALVASLAPHMVLAGVVALAGATAAFVLRTFIAPYLLFFRCTSGEAWSRFASLLRARPGAVLGLLVARAALSVALGAISTLVSTVTCCVGGLPVLHQTILAPVCFFDRAFTLHALASIDDEHALLAPER